MLPFSVADNKRDITTLAGYGEFASTYTPRQDYRVRLTVRKGGGSKHCVKGLGQLDMIFRIRGTDIQGFTQYTNGYGASLERYDEHEYSLRVGVVFSDFSPPWGEWVRFLRSAHPFYSP